jgi:hypothetical protein
MLKGETWLLHADLFKQHWIVEMKPWARNLGWFTKLQRTALAAQGWFVSGSNTLDDEAVIGIVDQPEAKERLHCYHNDQWWTYEGPVLLVAHGRVAGWAGPKVIIDDAKLMEEDPWQWPNIQLIDVEAKVTVTLDIEKDRLDVFNSSAYDTFTTASNLANGWMILSSGSKEYIDKDEIAKVLDNDSESIVHKLDNNVWLLNTKQFSLANVRLKPGYDLNDLRTSLSKCDAKFAWVSDTRDWPGWLPKDQYQMECIHVWPDENQKFGSELFIPVSRFLELTIGAEDLNAYPDIVFYDKPL